MRHLRLLRLSSNYIHFSSWLPLLLPIPVVAFLLSAMYAPYFAGLAKFHKLSIDAIMEVYPGDLLVLFLALVLILLLLLLLSCLQNLLSYAGDISKNGGWGHTPGNLVPFNLPHRCCRFGKNLKFTIFLFTIQIYTGLHIRDHRRLFDEWFLR